MKLNEAISATLLVIAMMFTLSACEEKGPLEETGEEIDEAFEDAGEAIDDAND